MNANSEVWLYIIKLTKFKHLTKIYLMSNYENLSNKYLF